MTTASSIAGETRQRIILFTDIEQANAPADGDHRFRRECGGHGLTDRHAGNREPAKSPPNYEDGRTYDHDGNPEHCIR